MFLLCLIEDVHPGDRIRVSVGEAGKEYVVKSIVIAGYIPAWMIIKRNTLDAILGR